MSVRDDYSFLTTYMEYGEEDEEEVDWDSVPSSHLYPEDVNWEDFDYDYFCHTNQFDDQLQYVRTRKALFMLAARSSGVSMDELSRITGSPKMTIAKQIDALDLTGINIADYSDYDKELPKLVADEREWEADIRYMHIRQAILMRVAHIKGMGIKTISRLSHIPPLTVAHQIQTLGL